MQRHVQGKILSPEEKHFIVALKQYFDRNKKMFSVRDSSVQMVADALSIGLATVNRVMAKYNKGPDILDTPFQAKGRPGYAVDVSRQKIVRAYIREGNLNGRHTTLESIRNFLQGNFPEDKFHISTLARTLDRWGFEFGKGIRTQHLKEKDYIVAARQRYLRKKRSNRLKEGKTIRPEVYVDESYVNTNHSNDFTWYFGEDGPWIKKPTGKGRRLIIMNAITCEGWVTGVKTVFKSSRKTGDYHGQMNTDMFNKWFKERLLPNIPPNSLIILDNASYHNILSDNSAPTPTCSKNRIRDWLLANRIPCSEDCLKAELIEALKRLSPEPVYVIDEIARQYGHEVIRTPPYHPELQPIEICWGIVKNELARNCKFQMRKLEIQLEAAWQKVTSETCRKVIEQVCKEEDRFWSEDAKLEKQVDTPI